MGWLGDAVLQGKVMFVNCLLKEGRACEEIDQLLGYEGSEAKKKQLRSMPSSSRREQAKTGDGNVWERAQKKTKVGVTLQLAPPMWEQQQTWPNADVPFFSVEQSQNCGGAFTVLHLHSNCVYPLSVVSV
jgi:hypothetical protein